MSHVLPVANFETWWPEMCQVWFHAFSVKSDQGSQRWPKGIAVYVNFSIPPSLVITQVKKSLKITFSSISPYSHNIFISFLFFSLLFQGIPPSSLLCTSPLLLCKRTYTKGQLVIEKIILATGKRTTDSKKERPTVFENLGHKLRTRLLEQRYKFADSLVFGWISWSREDRTSNSLHENKAKGVNAERLTTI